MHVGESEGGLVHLSTIKKSTSLADFLNWIVSDWCLNQGSIPSIHIKIDFYLFRNIGTYILSYLPLSIEVGLLSSSLMNPETPATNGIVMPATASKAIAWMNHLGESGLSFITATG